MIFLLQRHVASVRPNGEILSVLRYLDSAISTVKRWIHACLECDGLLYNNSDREERQTVSSVQSRRCESALTD